MSGVEYGVCLCRFRQESASKCPQMKGQTTNTTAQNSDTFVAALPSNYEEDTTAIDRAFFLNQLASQLYQ